MAALASAEPMLRPVPAAMWQVAGVSFFGYFLLYWLSASAGSRYLPAYRRLGRDKQIDWNTRLPSTVHALVVSALCLHQLLTGAFSDAAAASDGVPAVLRTTPVSWVVVGASLGYFSADGLMVFTQKALFGPMIAFHHVMALASLATAIDVRAVHAYVLFGLFTEVTTPFVNLRWRLYESGQAHRRIYVANGLAMTAVWGACRVTAFGPLFHHVWTHFGDAMEHLPGYAVGILLGVPALLFVLNVVWFHKMVQGAAKMLRKSSDGGAPKSPEGGRQQAAGAQGRAAGKGGRGADATVVVEAYAPAAAAPDARKRS